MRRRVFLIGVLLLPAFLRAEPPPFEFTAAEQAALAAAQENSTEMPQEQRLLLIATLRRAIAAGQLDRLTQDQKNTMMYAAYAASSDDASGPGLDPEERKRRLRDWVILYNELDQAVYPMLRPQPNRYIIGRDVGPVGVRTPVQPRPQPAPGSGAPSQPVTPITAPRADPAPQAPPPPVTNDMAPGGMYTADADGWNSSPPAPERAQAAGPAGPANGGKVDLSRAEGSVGRGAGAAAALADGTRSSPGAPGGPGGGAAPRGASGRAGSAPPPPPAPGALPSGDPSAPSTAGDLALAQGPYRAAFAAAGLSVGQRGGAPAVLRADGTPASPEEVRALSRDIAAMPRAAMRDPSYLDPQRGISWERFQDLKGGLAKNAGREELKHIGLSPDARDLQRTESCDKVSGSCNPLAKQSYKKGEDVPAKELDSIWSRINEYLVKSEAKAAGPRAARAALKSKGIWERVAAVFGLGEGSPAREARLAAAGGLAGGAAQLPAAAPGEAAQPAEGAAPAAPEEAPAPRRRSPLLGLLFAGGVVLAAVPLVRSRWLRG